MGTVKVNRLVVTSTKAVLDHETLLNICFVHLSWQNSIRHNLSQRDMFIRQTTPDGKLSYWTILPEANQCLTLDQIYKVGTIKQLFSL